MMDVTEVVREADRLRKRMTDQGLAPDDQTKILLAALKHSRASRLAEHIAGPRPDYRGMRESQVASLVYLDLVFQVPLAKACIVAMDLFGMVATNAMLNVRQEGRGGLLKLLRGGMANQFEKIEDQSVELAGAIKDLGIGE